MSLVRYIPVPGKPEPWKMLFQRRDAENAEETQRKPNPDQLNRHLVFTIFASSLRLSLRSLHCYPQEFCYFAQISCCPRQFRYRGVLRSGYGRNRDTSEIGEEIAMRVGNFLDQRVRPQHPQFPAHGCAAASALGSIGRFTTVEQALQVSVAESVQVEFTPTHGEKQSIVLSQNTQAADRSALPLGAPLQILRQFFQPSCVIHAGQSIRVPFRRLLRYLGPPVQIRYPAPHRTPGTLSIRIAFFGTIASERGHFVDGGLQAEKTAHGGVR